MIFAFVPTHIGRGYCQSFDLVLPRFSSVRDSLNLAINRMSEWQRALRKAVLSCIQAVYWIFPPPTRWAYARLTLTVTLWLDHDCNLKIDSFSHKDQNDGKNALFQPQFWLCQEQGQKEIKTTTSTVRREVVLGKVSLNYCWYQNNNSVFTKTFHLAEIRAKPRIKFEH